MRDCGGLRRVDNAEALQYLYDIGCLISTLEGIISGKNVSITADKCD